MTDQELMFEFLSLGEDCEFSFIQRKAKAEPLEMLRFTGTRLDQLLLAFQDGFAAIGEPDQTWIKVNAKKEVWLMNRRHRFESHTFQKHDQIDIPAFEAKQCTRLKFLRRKFYEDLEEGRKILVYKRRTDVAYEDVKKLHAAIRDVGPATLLWVVRHDDQHAPGTAERIGDGFLKGYIDEFTPHGRAAYGSFNVWMSICRAARHLWEAEASSTVA